MSEVAGTTVKVVVKATAGGARYEQSVETSATVGELKAALAEPTSIAASEQRLIYKGQILKDERTVDSYGIGEGHVLHMVRGKPAGNTQSSAAAAAPAAAAAAGAPASSGAAGAVPSPLGLIDADVMRNMMSSPMFQQLMANPEMMRSMLQMNPAVRELMDRDPALAQLLNNPELLRESFNMMSNPALMREYMRNNDRALSNIEALPGGFNALRQLYENVQEPLMSATSGAEGNPLASLLAGGAAGASGGGAAAAGSAGGAAPTSTSGGGVEPSSQPLPNPWAPAGAGGAGGAAAGGPEALLQSLQGMGRAGGMPGGGAGAADMAARMLENPQMREMMVSMFSQPGMFEAIAGSNPQLRGMLDAMPGAWEMLQNPDMLRMMLNPDMLRMASQLNPAMAGGAAGGGATGGMPDPAMLASLLSGMGGGAGAAAAGGLGGAGGAAGQGGGLDGLMQLMQGMGGFPGAFGAAGFGAPAPAPVADPATAYATQIQQLQDMGFFDQDANISALQATGGNVNAAVERLLNS